MKTIKEINQELIETLSFTQYVDLFTTMLKTLSERSLYFVENRNS